MKCVLCFSYFKERSFDEIMADEASEYLCDKCYKTDFEQIHALSQEIPLELLESIRLATRGDSLED